MKKEKWDKMKSMLIEAIRELNIDKDDIEEVVARCLFVSANSRFFISEEIANDNCILLERYNWSMKEKGEDKMSKKDWNENKVLHLANRMNEIRNQINSLEMEYNEIISKLWEEIPSLKDDVNTQKIKVKEK